MIRRSTSPPNPDKLLPTPGSIFERMKLDERAAKNIYELAFVIAPLTLAGTAGSTTAAPIVIR